MDFWSGNWEAVELTIQSPLLQQLADLIRLSDSIAPSEPSIDRQDVAPQGDSFETSPRPEMSALETEWQGKAAAASSAFTAGVVVSLVILGA